MSYPVAVTRAKLVLDVSALVGGGGARAPLLTPVEEEPEAESPAEEPEAGSLESRRDFEYEWVEEGTSR